MKNDLLSALKGHFMASKRWRRGFERGHAPSYMPWTKLAVVNFTSAEACQRCHRGFAGCTETGIRFVGQAVMQGIRANLITCKRNHDD